MTATPEASVAVNRHVKGGRYLPGRVGSYHKAAGDHDEHAEEQDQNLDSDLGGQGILLPKDRVIRLMDRWRSFP